MRRKVVALLLLSTMSASLLVGCSGSSSEKAVSGSEVKELKQALAELEANEDYLVQTLMEAPDGNATYLEVVHNGGSYTEMPVDSDGKITDTLITDEENTGNYALVDWLKNDGTMYMTYTDESGNAGYYSLPKEYGKEMLSRNSGYFEDMVDHFTSVEKQKDTVTGDVGDGEEEFTMYECTLPDEYVKEILGANTYGLYSVYAEDEDTDKNVKQLCEYYLEDLDMALTFSDAKVTVAVANGNLRQVVLETGGLGTKMYVTKTFLMNSEYDLREEPDFSKASDYTDSMKELADFVADYDSYEEAMAALNSEDGTTSEETEATEEGATAEEGSETEASESSTEETTATE